MDGWRLDPDGWSRRFSIAATVSLGLSKYCLTRHLCNPPHHKVRPNLTTFIFVKWGAVWKISLPAQNLYAGSIDPFDCLLIQCWGQKLSNGTCNNRYSTKLNFIPTLLFSMFPYTVQFDILTIPTKKTLHAYLFLLNTIAWIRISSPQKNRNKNPPTSFLCVFGGSTRIWGSSR